MTRVLVVAPHLDDAVLSLGDHLAEWEELAVLTVLAGAPAEPLSTDYDARSGFTDSNQAIHTRRKENDAALAYLGVDSIFNGDLVESAYADQAADPSVVEELIGDVIALVRPVEIVGPLGLHHSDHLLVAEAFRRVVYRSTLPACVVEESPYRVLFPREVEPALDRWRWTTCTPTRLDEPIEGSGSNAKRQAVAAFESQLWAIEGPAVYCPERLWRVR